MTKKTENGSSGPKSINPSSITSQAHVSEGQITVVVSTRGQDPINFNYDSTTPSNEIVKHSIETSGMNLEQAEVEIITETLERSRNLFDRGIEVAFGIAGKSFSFKIPSKFEKKTITKTVYKPPKK